MFQTDIDPTGKKVYLPSFAVDVPAIPKPEPPDKAFRMPVWNCYCCQDKGYVSSHLMRLVCPEYHTDTHPTVQCPCPYSEPFPGAKLLTEKQRLELDAIAREQWRDTAKVWQERQPKFTEELNEVQNAIEKFTQGFNFTRHTGQYGKAVEAVVYEPS